MSTYGYANPELHKALIQFCFGKSCDQAQKNIQLIDSYIQKDKLSGEQLRILPLIYSKRNNIDLSSLSGFSKSRIKSIYKHTLCRNNLLLKQAEDFIRLLDFSSNNNIICLKGMAQLLREPDKLGARPMADIDLLVPGLLEHQQQYLNIINNNNYIITSSNLRAVSIKDNRNYEYDLHWLLHDWALKKSTIDQLVQYSIKVEYNFKKYSIPCLEHHLAHIIAHGMLEPTLRYDARWVIDVIDVLLNYRELNQEVFINFVNTFIVPQAVSKALVDLSDNLPSNIEIPRNYLSSIAHKINKSNIIVACLYQQKPLPNEQDIVKHNSSKMSVWLRSFLKSKIYGVWVLYKYNSYNFSQLLTCILGFEVSNLSVSGVLNKLGYKIKQRLLAILRLA